MCFLCTQDNPFDTIRISGAFGGVYGGELGKIKAEIQATKRALKDIETKIENGEALCEEGDEVKTQLREKQYELARHM